jgi:hypothetical protein
MLAYRMQSFQICPKPVLIFRIYVGIFSDILWNLRYRLKFTFDFLYTGFIYCTIYDKNISTSFKIRFVFVLLYINLLAPEFYI